MRGRQTDNTTTVCRGSAPRHKNSINSVTASFYSCNFLLIIRLDQVAKLKTITVSFVAAASN